MALLLLPVCFFTFGRLLLWLTGARVVLELEAGTTWEMYLAAGMPAGGATAIGNCSG